MGLGREQGAGLGGKSHEGAGSRGAGVDRSTRQDGGQQKMGSLEESGEQASRGRMG